MAPLLELYLDQFLVFVLVLTRISGLILTAPVFGARAAPIRVRGLMAVGLSLIVATVHFGVSIEPPRNVLLLAVMLAGEAVIGLALGLGVAILFSGLQGAGQVIGQMSGMALADVFDPTTESSVPMFSQLLDLVTLAAFVCIGGHRQVMGALLETFAAMPPGQALVSDGLLEAIVQVTTHSFVLGVRVTAPLVVALLMSALIMGLISRTLPQLNIMAVGFSFNTMIALVSLMLCLGAMVWIFQEEAEAALDTLRAALVAAR